MRRHIVLVGLSGSGKSTAGRLAATTLGAGFVDVDAEIEDHEGLPISRIFAERGEAAFRAQERERVVEALEGKPGVIAPGAGWAAQPGNLETAAAGTMVIYLRTDPEVAATRAAAPANRPLLAGGNPTVRMQELLAEREAFYRAGDETVETTNRTVAGVAQQVVVLARSRGGW